MTAGQPAEFPLYEYGTAIIAQFDSVCNVFRRKLTGTMFRFPLQLIAILPLTKGRVSFIMSQTYVKTDAVFCFYRRKETRR